MTPQTLKGIANDAVIGPGAVVGGRFEVRDLVVTLGSIPIYAAKDQKTQRPVALWMIPRGGLDDRAVEATRQAVRGAAFPVPGGLGVQEGGFVVLGHLLGIDAQTSIALSLVKRTPDVLLGLPALFAWHWFEARRRRVTTQSVEG